MYCKLKVSKEKKTYLSSAAYPPFSISYCRTVVFFYGKTTESWKAVNCKILTIAWKNTIHLCRSFSAVNVPFLFNSNQSSCWKTEPPDRGNHDLDWFFFFTTKIINHYFGGHCFEYKMSQSQNVLIKEQQWAFR